jgi:predicted enzyme related to lactoylglutathione lyase
MSKLNPVVHFEMPYENNERLTKFYESAFGWKMQNMGKEMGDYIIAVTSEVDENNKNKTPGTINGGFFPRNPEVSQYPSFVIAVENIAESMKNIKNAGGNILGEPMMIPNVGQFVSFTDSEGNRVSILQPSSM